MRNDMFLQDDEMEIPHRGAERQCSEAGMTLSLSRYRHDSRHSDTRAKR